MIDFENSVLIVNFGELPSFDLNNKSPYNIQEVTLDEYIGMLDSIHSMNISYPLKSYSIEPNGTSINSIYAHCNSTSSLSVNELAQVFSANELFTFQNLNFISDNTCNSLVLNINSNKSLELSGFWQGLGPIQNLFVFNENGFNITNLHFDNISNVHFLAQKLPSEFTNLAQIEVLKLLGSIDSSSGSANTLLTNVSMHNGELHSVSTSFQSDIHLQADSITVIADKILQNSKTYALHVLLNSTSSVVLNSILSSHNISIYSGALKIEDSAEVLGLSLKNQTGTVLLDIKNNLEISYKAKIFASGDVEFRCTANITNNGGIFSNQEINFLNSTALTNFGIVDAGNSLRFANSALHNFGLMIGDSISIVTKDASLALGNSFKNIASYFGYNLPEENLNMLSKDGGVAINATKLVINDVTLNSNKKLSINADAIAISKSKLSANSKISIKYKDGEFNNNTFVAGKKVLISDTLNGKGGTSKFENINFITNDAKIESQGLVIYPTLISEINSNKLVEHFYYNQTEQSSNEPFKIGNLNTTAKLHFNLGNQPIKINLPITAIDLWLETNAGVEIAAHLTLNNLFIEAKGCKFTYGEYSINNATEFVLNPITGSLLFDEGVKLITDYLDINKESYEKKAQLVQVLSAEVHVNKGSKIYAEKLEVIAKDYKTFRSELDHAAIRAQHPNMVNIIGYVASFAGKNIHGTTKSILGFASDGSHMSAYYFTEEYSSKPSAYLDLAIIEGNIKTIKIDNSLLKGKIKFDETSKSTIENHIHVLNKILEIYYQCQYWTSQCQADGNNFPATFKQGWAYHGMDTKYFHSKMHILMDGIYSQPYKHLTSTILVDLISGHFDRITIGGENTGSSTALTIGNANNVLTTISKGMVQANQNLLDQLAKVIGHGNQVANLNPKRPVQFEDQLSIPTLNIDNFGIRYNFNANYKALSDGSSKANYIFVEKMFKEYACDYSIERLITELGFDISKVGNIICPESCTTSMIEDALFKATGVKNLEDLSVSLKKFFQDNNATYKQKQCFQIQVLVENAVKYAKQFNFVLGDPIAETLADSFAEPFVWVINIILEKDNKKFPTSIPVIYMPKEMLANNSAFRAGSAIIINEANPDATVDTIKINAGELQVNKGTLNANSVIVTGSILQKGNGQAIINANDVYVAAAVDTKVSHNHITSYQNTHPSIIAEGHLIFNSTSNTIVGTDIEGRVTLNATTNIVAPHQLVTGLWAEGEWGHVRLAEVINIPSTVNGELKLNGDNGNILIGVNAGKATTIEALSKNGTNEFIVCVDQKLLDILTIQKKKGFLKSKTTTTHTIDLQSEIKGNQYGTNTIPMRMFYSYSANDTNLVGFSLHAYNITFLSDEQINISPAVARNFHKEYTKVEARGFLGMSGGFKIKLFHSKEDLLQEDYTVVKQSEIVKYGLSEAVFNGTHGVNFGSTIYRDMDGSNLTIIAEKGNVTMTAGNYDLHNKFKQTKVTDGYWKNTANLREISASAEYHSEKRSDNFHSAKPVANLVQAHTINIKALNYIEQGNYLKYVNLNINGNVTSLPQLYYIEQNSKDISVDVIAKAGFFNNFADSYDKTVALSNSNGNPVTTTFAIADIIFSLVKAFLIPVSFDIKLEARFEQNEIQMKSIKVYPSKHEGTGNVTINGVNVLMEGTQVVGANWLINADTVKFEKAFSSFETKQESMGAAGTVSFIDLGRISANIDFKKLKEESHIATNLFFKLSGAFELKADSAHIEGKILASDLKLYVGKLVLKSIQNILKREGRGGSFGASTSLSLDNLDPRIDRIGAEFERRDTKWISEVSSLIGSKSVHIVVREMAHIIGGMVAQAKIDSNGNLVDGGNLEFKAFEILCESLYSYDKGHLLGAAFGIDLTNKKAGFGDRFDGAFGLVDKMRTDHATIGKGKVEVDKVTGDLNRDINAATEEDGYKIDETRFFWQRGFDKTIETFKEVVENPYVVLERAEKTVKDAADQTRSFFNKFTGREKDLSIWDVIDLKDHSQDMFDKEIEEDLEEDEVEDEVHKNILEEEAKEASEFDDAKFDRNVDADHAKPAKNLKQIKVDIASVDIHGVLVGSPDMQEASIKLYQHMVRNGLSENEALALIGNKLIEVHNNPFATPQNAAFHLALGGAIEACAINPTCANFVAITLTAAFATGKINAEGFDIAPNIDTTLSTPANKINVKDEGFIPEKIDTTLPSFEIDDFDFGDEGFVMPERIDTTILSKVKIVNGKVDTKDFELKHSEGGIHGGHSEQKHIELNEKDLNKRIVEEGKKAASTFPDYNTANKAVIEVLEHNNDDIVKWAKSAPEGRPQSFIKEFDHDIGHGITKDGTKFGSNKAKIVLVKVGDDIEVLTSYPVR